MAPFYFSVALSANVRTMHWQSPMACAAGAVVNQNQSVMKAKIKSTGEIIEVEKIDGKKACMAVLTALSQSITPTCSTSQPLIQHQNRKNEY